MGIQLPFGKTSLDLELPANLDITVIESRFVPAVENPLTLLINSLQNPINSLPLSNRVRADQSIGIIINDVTRATPSRLILTAILSELPHIPRENITLFIALGSHRPNTPQEIEAILGRDYVETFRIVQNTAFDQSTQINIGKSRLGHDIWLNRELIGCDFKILTGFIEPHFFAGFSGGGKAVMPGMAGIESIMQFHSAEMIGHPNSVWGVGRGNPIWEEAREAALMTGETFLVNVCLNRDKDITSVFAGELGSAHDAGCAEVKRLAMIQVDKPFDIVITTNSGYPLDQNLYQSVKGMSSAAQVVREGGSIIIATGCSDGIPDHGLYGQILAAHSNPRDVLDEIYAGGKTRQDQWQIQIQTQIQLKSDVYVHSNCLSDEQIKKALLTPCHKIEDTVNALLTKYGRHARICVIPEGPLTIPCLSIK